MNKQQQPNDLMNNIQLLVKYIDYVNSQLDDSEERNTELEIENRHLKEIMNME